MQFHQTCELYCSLLSNDSSRCLLVHLMTNLLNQLLLFVLQYFDTGTWPKYVTYFFLVALSQSWNTWQYDLNMWPTFSLWPWANHGTYMTIWPKYVTYFFLVALSTTLEGSSCATSFSWTSSRRDLNMVRRILKVNKKHLQSWLRWINIWICRHRPIAIRPITEPWLYLISRNLSLSLTSLGEKRPMRALVSFTLQSNLRRMHLLSDPCQHQGYEL